MTEPDTDLGDTHSLQLFDQDEQRLLVTAFAVVQNGAGPRLERTLAALADQSRKPDRVVVVDATPTKRLVETITAHKVLMAAYPQLSVVTAPPGVTAFADILDSAVQALPEPGENVVVPRRPRGRARKRLVRPRDKYEWFWLLHEDSAPDVGALQALTRVVGQSNRIGVAGCKVVEFDDARQLVNVGVELTRTGRHVGERTQGEPDQGQHDGRRDVLGVSSGGMLIRRDVYTSLGGFDPAFDGDGDGLDVCWRAHLTGHQVVVVPAARVRSDTHSSASDADHPAPRSTATLRRHRQVALARSSLLGLPVMALWTFVSSFVLALALLLVKRPRRAWRELAQASAPFGLVRILGARSRFLGRGSTRRRNLASLFVPLSAATGFAYAGVRDALERDHGSSRNPYSAATESGPSSAEADSLGAAAVRPSHLWSNPGWWAVVAMCVAAGVLWRHQLGSDALRGTAQGFAGGELRPFATDATGIWRMWRDAWQGPGLGHANIATPYLPVMAAIAWVIQWVPGVNDAASGATVVGWLLFLAMPLSTLTAYRASRVATRARWPRAAAGLLWGSAATLTTGISQGRLGPVVAHILLPLALAGICAMGRRRVSTPVVCATLLAAAGIGAFAPGVLVVLSVFALGLLVFGSGAGRWRGVLFVVPWLLLGAWLAVVRDDWRAALAGPGTLDLTHGTLAKPWQLALGHPGGPGSYAVLAGVPFIAVALLGLLRPRFGRAAIALIAMAAIGLFAGVAAPHLVLTDDGLGARTPWTGSYLDIYLAALLGLGVLGTRGLAIAGSARRGVARAVSVLAVIAVAGGAAVAGFAAWTAPVALLAAAPTLPAIAAEGVDGPRAVRALVLTVAADGSIGYDLVGRETGRPATDLQPEAPSADGRSAAAVTALLGSGSQPQPVAVKLQQLAVGYLVVQGPRRTSVTAALQGVNGISAVTPNATQEVWRVDPVTTANQSVGASRVYAAGAAGPVQEVDSRPAHGRLSRIVTLPNGTTSVQLSEGAGWVKDGRVSFAGKQIAPTKDAAVPTYPLPATTGALVIDPGIAHPLVAWLQGILLAVVVFLAVPFGNRRSRGVS